MITFLKKISYDDKLLLAAGFIVLAVSVSFRMWLLNLPIDRDEGEFAYAGWRMLHGEIPFRDFYNMKMPGIYAFYALLFFIFGPTVQAIRAGLIIVNLINAFLIYRIAGNFSLLPAGSHENTGKGLSRMGIYASICYLLISMQVEFQGTSTHAEHIAMLFVLSGFSMLGSAVSRTPSRLFLSGVLLGTGFVIKQPAASFIVLALVLLFMNHTGKKISVQQYLKSVSLIIAGAVLPFLVIVLLLISAGAGKSFYLFAFQYAKEYVSYLTLQDGINNFKIILSKAAAPGILLWMLVPAGAAVLFFKPVRSGIRSLLFFLFSFIAVSTGYYFRPHYFQFLIPSASILAAAALVAGENFFIRKNISALKQLSLVYLLAASSYYVYHNRSLFSSRNEEEVIRNIYGQDFFNATKKAGEFIAAHSSENAAVAIFGAEPEIWFYSKRRAASGYLYVYPMLEHQKFAPAMLRQFYDEVIKSDPEILVYTSNAGTWYADYSVQAEMVGWYSQYRDSMYSRIGLINIPYDAATTYDWSGDTTVALVNENYIEICKRNMTTASGK